MSMQQKFKSWTEPVETSEEWAAGSVGQDLRPFGLQISDPAGQAAQTEWISYAWGLLLVAFLEQAAVDNQIQPGKKTK